MKEGSRFFSNRKCEYYPCHETDEELNCLFCYCPLYHFQHCPGNPVYKEKNGHSIKVCTNCTFPHRAENYDKIRELLSKNISGPAADDKAKAPD